MFRKYFAKGDKQIVLKRILERHPRVRDSNELLHEAVFFKRTRMYKYLCEYGFELNLAEFVCFWTSRKLKLAHLTDLLRWFFRSFETDVNVAYRRRNAISYLFEYVRSTDRDFSAVEMLLSRNADVCAIDGRGFSAVFYAAGKSVFCSWLLRLKVDLNPISIYQMSRNVFDYLFRGDGLSQPATDDFMLRVIFVIQNVKCWNRECLRRLIALRDERNNSIFHWLVKGDLVRYVMELYFSLETQNFCDSLPLRLNATNDRKRTCLFYARNFAAYSKLTGVVDSGLRDDRGETAVQRVYRGVRSFLPLDRFSESYRLVHNQLLQADPTLGMPRLSALHADVVTFNMASFREYFDLGRNRRSVVQRLLNDYPGLADNHDLLNYAIFRRKARICKYLFGVGMKPNLARLMLLCIGEKLTCVAIGRLLVWFFERFDADVNETHDFRTAASYLFEYVRPEDSCLDAVKVLFERGADFFETNEKVLPAIFHVYERSHLFHLLDRLGVDVRPIRLRFRDESVFQYLFGSPVGVERTSAFVVRALLAVRDLGENCWTDRLLSRLMALRDPDGNGPFHWLVKEDHFEYAMRLYARCSDSDALLHSRNRKGRTCLFYVKDLRNYAGMVVSSGFDPHIRDERGETALQKIRRKTMVFLPVKSFSTAYYGAFRNCFDLENVQLRNVLHRAVESSGDLPKTVRIFEKFERQFYNFRNLHGQTPLHLADDPAVKEVLVGLGCDPNALDSLGNRAGGERSGVCKLEDICLRNLDSRTYRLVPDVVKYQVSLRVPGDFFYEREIARCRRSEFVKFVDDSSRLMNFFLQ